MALSPQEWSAALSPTLPAFSHSATIQRETRELITLWGKARGTALSTSELADKLWPWAERHVDPAARKRLTAYLSRLATLELADCATRGPAETKRIYGKPTLCRPWQWHAPCDGSEGHQQTECPKCHHRFDVV